MDVSFANSGQLFVADSTFSPGGRKLSRMPRTVWNSDVDYVFSMHKVGLWIFACWPLQRFDVFAKARWALTIVLQVSAVISLTIEIFRNRSNSGTAMEGILILECVIITMSKHGFLIVHAKKLEENVGSAAGDWRTARNGGTSREIMRKYARASRKLTSLLLFSGVMFSLLYVSGIMIFDREQPADYGAKNDTGGSRYAKFPLPSSWLSDKLTKGQYVSLVVLQTVQVIAFTSENCLVDSFLLNVVMHLSGQFEILVRDFSVLGTKARTETKHRLELHSLVKRHCRLVGLTRNLQESFSAIILLQLGLAAILIALQGFCLISSIRDHERVVMIKSVLVLSILFMQCGMYVYTGDVLTRRTEEIFHALFAAPWYNLPTGLMMDVKFVMLRTMMPLHLRGGKFFVVSRSIIIYILKTAGSYISVFLVALKD